MDRNDRALTAFAMVGHATFHAFELVIPIFVVVWLDVFSTSPALLGVVVGASYAFVGLGAVPSGILADRFSSRRLIVVCLAGMGGSFALVSLATDVTLLAVGLLAWGLFASIYHPAGLALLSRGATERGRAFAYHGAAGNVGVATGPLLAALLLSVLHWRVVVLALLVPAAIAVAVGLRLEFDERAGVVARNGGSEVGEGQVRSLRSFARRSKHLFTAGFGLVIGVGVLYGVYYRGATTFLPGVLADLPIFDPVTVGGRPVEPSQYVYSGLLLLGAVGQYAGGRLIDDYPLERLLVATYVGLVVVALAFVPAGTAGVGPLLVVAGTFGFLVYLAAPVNQEAISTYSPPAVRGLSFGYSYTAIFGVGAAGSALAGVVLSRSTAAVLFLILAGLAGVAAMVGLALLAFDLRPGGDEAGH